MRCGNCGERQAAYHIKSNINGEERELHLCPDCAERLGLVNSGSSFAKTLFGAAAPLFAGPFEAGASGAKGRSCPVCKTSQEEIAKTGYAGCSECYKTFGDIFKGYISRLHGDAVHRGRTPRSFRSGKYAHRFRAERLAALDRELKEAVRIENYERAAKLKEEITALSGENGQGV